MGLIVGDRNQRTGTRVCKAVAGLSGSGETQGKGLLVVFVRDNHTLKMEVGYALEGIFTDAFCAAFQPTIKSYYAGGYFGDVFAGIIIWMERTIISGEEAEFDDELKSLWAEPELSELPDAFLSGGAGIVDNENFYDRETKLSKITTAKPLQAF